MGLLMFREPEPEPKTHTIKLDPTEHARSPIRRHHHRTREHRAAIQRQIEREHQHQERINARADRQALYDILREDPGRDNDHALRRETRNAWASDDSFRDRDPDEINRRRLESGRALLTESLSYERPGHRMRLPRESALRYEMSAANSPPSQLRERVRTDANWIPFPRSFPEYEVQRSSSPRDEVPSSRSRRFAPAYRLTDSSSEPPRSPRYADARRSSATPVPHDEHNRATTRGSRDTPIPEMVITQADGLGDRRRSFSPEESTWATLFTTITPDERLPSAESSFTSATASAASSLSSHSGSSSSTLLTAPSSNAATIRDFSHICDEPSEPSGSDTEDDFPLGDYAEALPLVDVPGPPAVNLPESTSRDEDAGRAGQPNSRHQQDLEDRHASRRWRNAELRHLHAIHERLERQLPVPDEWWASAGLSPNLGVRADRAERGRL